MEIGTSGFQHNSMTSPIVYSLQYDQGENSYLLFLNEETGTIYMNDAKTKKLFKKIQITSDTTNHKKAFQGFYYHNRDSIFLFSYGPKVIMINDAGKVLKQYNLLDGNDQKDKKFFGDSMYRRASLPTSITIL